MKTRLVLASILAVGLLAACPSKKGPGAAGPSARPQTLESLLPADTQLVLGLSVEKVRATKLWERFAPVLLSEGKETLDEVRTACGLDLVADAVSIVVASTDLQDDQAMVFLVKARWTQDKGNRCLAAMTERKSGQKVTITQEGRITAYVIPNDRQLYAAWVADDTVLVTADPTSRGRLEQVLEGGPRMETNAAFMAALGKADRAATLWGAAAIPPEAARDLEGTLPSPPQTVYFQIEYVRALSARIGLRFADGDGAAAASSLLEAQLEEVRNAPMVGDFARAVTTRAEGSDALISVELAEEQVDGLVAMIEGQLGMFLGGALGGDGGAVAPVEE